MTQDAQISIRLASETLAQLRRIAQAEDRSLNYIIRRAIESHLSQR